jgi:FkbM family methyltransferase
LVETALPFAPAWVRIAAPIVAHLPAGRYRAIRHLCHRRTAAFLMRMPKDLGGYSFQCDLRDAISRDVCFTGRYEPQETAIVKSILRSGMTFIDVGANWGYFTLLAASLVGKGGRVLSLEPDPRLFPILGENVARSELGQVTVLPIAAATERGMLTLAGYDESQENFGLSKLVTVESETKQTFQVKADSLDNILDYCRVDSVDLLKMDIEGAENFAIAGLKQSLLARRVKRLLLELHPVELAEHGSSAADVINSLHQAGYRAWTIDHSPAATRRAAYGKAMTLDLMLQPLSSSAELDQWPHQLWLAPGIN